MKFITIEDYKTLSKKSSYYDMERWEYFSAVIEILKQIKFDTALELGACLLPIVKNSDTFDKTVWNEKPTYLHDATKFPYPVEDRKYDLFISLQVWEHLEGKQKEAFAEVRRISKMAIFSFPYKWDCPGDCHNGIDEKKISEWTMNTKPVKVLKVGIRIIYFFKFE